MAVTNESSTEYLKTTDPRTYGSLTPEQAPKDIKFVPFTFTQGAAAGDATSTAQLAFLEGGRFVVLPKLSFIDWSAFGAARVLDIGLSAYTDEDGNTVAAAPTAFDEDIDVSAAGRAAMGSDIAAVTGGRFLVKSRSGVTIVATVAGGTIPAGATLTGYLAVAAVGT